LITAASFSTSARMKVLQLRFETTGEIGGFRVRIVSRHGATSIYSLLSGPYRRRRENPGTREEPGIV